MPYCSRLLAAANNLTIHFIIIFKLKAVFKRHLNGSFNNVQCARFDAKMHGLEL
jgi:hypothetical protein